MSAGTASLAGLDADVLMYGCGTMAGAMLARWLSIGLDPTRVTAIRPSGAPAPGGVRTRRSADGVPSPDLLLIGVKPQTFAAVAGDVARLAGRGTLVVSIMAGIGLADLRAALPDAGAVVRAMPNMPVLHGRGVVACVGDAGQAAPLLASMLAPLGHVHSLTDEAGFDLVTALTGCGPAFVYRFVGALADAAASLGLDPADADALARATVAGAAASLAESNESPAALARKVASAGGMTQAGLDVLDADAALATLLCDTLRAARDRGQALAAPVRA